MTTRTAQRDWGQIHRAQDALAALMARRRTNGQVYMGGESDPTPGEIRAAEMYVRDLLDAGWTPPPRTSTTTRGEHPMTKPTEWTRYLGYWCDNCRTAWPYRPGTGNCPDCRTVALRPADVTVAPHDTNSPRESTR